MKTVGINVDMSLEENEVVEELKRLHKLPKRQVFHDLARETMIRKGMIKQNASDKARGLV